MSLSPDVEQLPSYSNPPVMEVSFGIAFATTEPVQTRHLGQFWESACSKYPKTSDALPILDPAELPLKLSAPVPIPLRRVMAYDPANEFVAQIQDTRLYLNWRRSDPTQTYPRFPIVKSRFGELWEGFLGFAETHGLGQVVATRFELTYVNQIRVGEGGILGAIERYLRPFRFSDVAGLAQAESVSSTWRFRMPELAGTGSIALGNIAGDSGSLNLTVACSADARSAGSQDQWFDGAHRWIVREFTELTTPAGHTEWGREK